MINSTNKAWACTSFLTGAALGARILLDIYNTDPKRLNLTQVAIRIYLMTQFLSSIAARMGAKDPSSYFKRFTVLTSGFTLLVAMPIISFLGAVERGVLDPFAGFVMGLPLVFLSSFFVITITDHLEEIEKQLW